MKYRESQVLALLLEGLSNKEIARRLGISERAVKFHVASIYKQHGARNSRDFLARSFRETVSALLVMRGMDGEDDLPVPDGVSAAVHHLIAGGDEDAGDADR